MKFNRDNIEYFSFDKYEYDFQNGKAKFYYSFDDSIIFTEEIIFNNSPKSLSMDKQVALDRILSYLHLALGVSYYKAAVPSKIIVKTGDISKHTGLFFDKLYLNGLDEFAYTNNLSLKKVIKFPFSDSKKNLSVNINLKDRAVLPIGGGKDSLVAYDIIKSSGNEFCLFHIGDHSCYKELQTYSKNNIINIHRKISNNIIKLNNMGAYNGHIPISSIFAFLSLAASVIYDYNTVIMSNERSANVGSIMSDGKEVNHQYSKSLEFETDFSKLVSDEIINSYAYFSMLRPFSELSISKMFSKLTYAHDMFISCNQASKLKNKLDKWCLNCPKCRFVFLSLSPYIKKNDLINIFGFNLLDDPSQENGYMALVGIDDSKPFECVGEIEESIVAFSLVSKNNEWHNDLIVKKIMNRISLSNDELVRLTNEVLQPRFDSNIPSRYLKMINDYCKL
ncbi:MAG: hypothetical protein V3V22_07420 [Methylococcales bacterium]